MNLWRRSQRFASLWLALAAVGGCGDLRPEKDGRVDLLVFAPHPDDEVLGCGGILLQALARGERVKIVIFTNGDGFPGAASLVSGKPAERLVADDYLELARFRQGQSQAALATLGAGPAISSSWATRMRGLTGSTWSAVRLRSARSSRSGAKPTAWPSGIFTLRGTGARRPTRMIRP